MKKSNFRKLLLICAIFASVASFAYINTRQVNITNFNSNISPELPNEENREDAILPEVQLVKKIIQKSREVLPATRY